MFTVTYWVCGETGVTALTAGTAATKELVVAEFEPVFPDESATLAANAKLAAVLASLPLIARVKPMGAKPGGREPDAMERATTCAVKG